MEKPAAKKIIVISAINIFTAGMLSIVRDFLSALVAGEAFLRGEFRVVVFCHSNSLYAGFPSKNIIFIEKPLSRKSWFFRLFYEYIWFWFWSLFNDVYFWFSAHDVTPNVRAEHRAVYCHNSAPFYDGPHLWRYAPTFEIFRLFYGCFYRINLKMNDHVIVQQQWMREEFVHRFGCAPAKVIVARPETVASPSRAAAGKRLPSSKTTLIFPAYPRAYKNFDVIIDAMRGLEDVPIELLLTFSGKESPYALKVYRELRYSKNIRFTGFLTREKLFAAYADVDALVFPSKLESWGLPLSEFRSFGKPIFAADLPYAKETLSGYGNASYFQPDDAAALGRLLRRFALSRDFIPTCYNIRYSRPFAENWDDLLELIGLT